MSSVILLLLAVMSFSTAEAVLWQKIETCKASLERVEGIKAQYPSIFYGEDNDASRLIAYQYLTALPDQYLGWAFSKHKLRVQLRPVPNLTVINKGTADAMDHAGTTWIKGVVPNAMSLTVPVMINGKKQFGIIHEMGHVIDRWLVETKRQYRIDTDVLFAKYVKSKPASQRVVWFLAQQSDDEFSAELFESYYCSPRTRAKLKAEYPDAYKVAEKWFLTPPVEDGLE